jgi:hypothetical protein
LKGDKKVIRAVGPFGFEQFYSFGFTQSNVEGSKPFPMKKYFHLIVLHSGPPVGRLDTQSAVLGRGYPFGLRDPVRVADKIFAGQTGCGDQNQIKRQIWMSHE